MEVTVAIPCYNGARYLERTIQSVLAQSRSADDIMVIDDGSTDGSANVTKSFPVRLIQHQRNKGLAEARNTAIAAARGDVLAFIDVDALADSDWLGVLLSGYVDGTVGGVGGQGVESVIRSRADRWRREHASQSHGDRPKEVAFLFGLCMSFRLEALRTVGGFNPLFRTNAEDMDIGLRLNAAGYRLRYLPGAKVYHQRTDDEASLMKTMAAWYTGAYRAKRINEAQPWKLFVGTMRRMATEPLLDILYRRDPALAWLSWRIGWTKLRALWQIAIDS